MSVWLGLPRYFLTWISIFHFFRGHPMCGALARAHAGANRGRPHARADPRHRGHRRREFCHEPKFNSDHFKGKL